MHDLALKTKELQLEGFHCADCADTIEKTVAKVGGVHTVTANFASGKVRVRYDPDQVGYTDLVNTVEKIGYRVKNETHRKLEKSSIWQDKKFLFMLGSGVAIAAGLTIKFFTIDLPMVTFREVEFAISSVLFIIATFFGAYHFSREAWAAIKSLRLNMAFLMSLAIIGAVIIQEYVEAASLAFLFSLAELLEAYAIDKARNSLRELMTLTPEEAHIKKGKRESTLPVDEVEVGDILIVRPGERVPLDGVIIKGTTSVDQSPITGESLPVKKEPGENLYAGSINNEGYLEVKVTKNSDNTMLARIIHLVEEAESQKAPSERFVEKFAKIYTPTVVAIAVGVSIIPPLILQMEFSPWFIKALTLLVIACPCALVISTPVSVVSALTSASRNGILIKGGVYLEEMSKVEVIALDKTGTLTHGQLRVTDVIAMNGLAEEELLSLAASLEIQSEHPIAKAIVGAANNKTFEDIEEFESVPGKGLMGRLNGKKYAIGRPELFKGSAIEIPSKQLQLLQSQGKTTMLVGTQSEIVGIIGLADVVRDDAVETVFKLKAAGKEVVMITGDNEETAKAIANQLGITHYHAALLPEDKVDEIKYLQKKHGNVAMVGDGINDAPALAAASVGIAMGAAGTDTALETADVALMSDDLTKLPYLVELSQRANVVIKENTLAAILIKFSLAIGVFPGLVSLVVAVLVGDMGASLGVISNAMRLARVKPKG